MKGWGGHNKLQNIVPTPLGNHLRSVRENKGWSLREAANKIGLHNSVISQIETGYIIEPSVKNIVYLAKGYDISLLQLIELMGYDISFTFNKKPVQMTFKLGEIKGDG